MKCLVQCVTYNNPTLDSVCHYCFIHYKLLMCSHYIQLCSRCLGQWAKEENRRHCPLGFVYALLFQIIFYHSTPAMLIYLTFVEYAVHLFASWLFQAVLLVYNMSSNYLNPVKMFPQEVSQIPLKRKQINLSFQHVLVKQGLHVNVSVPFTSCIPWRSSNSSCFSLQLQVMVLHKVNILLMFVSLNCPALTILGSSEQAT